MAAIINKRMSVDIEGNFVVFLIGMRINKPWKLNQWLPVAMAMPKMLTELSKRPEMGLLGFESFFGFPTTLMVQYWRSFEHLEAYARNKDAEHFPAWVDFNRRVASNGNVGIWHETYLVNANQYEVIYNNMPAFGLGKVGTPVPAIGYKKTAAARLGNQVELEATST